MDTSKLHLHPVRTILIVLLLGLCAYQIWALGIDLRDTYRTSDEYIRYNQGDMMRGSDPLTASDLQSWMTFSYINFVFKLPPNYLRSSLNIQDPRYPNIQIRRYVRLYKLSLSTFLASIEHAVTVYHR